jgi:hypothetical protein
MLHKRAIYNFVYAYDFLHYRRHYTMKSAVYGAFSRLEVGVQAIDWLYLFDRAHA